MQEFYKINKVAGELTLPGDKSISHRSVIFSCLADGVSTIKNLSNGEDVKSTMSCFKKLGCKIEQQDGLVKITGKGFGNFTEPKEALDAGNSGTTARLISGILAVQKFKTVVAGDESLSKRPMKRVIEPLELMGGKIKASEGMTLPMEYYPSENINVISYELPVASAQVKSAILLAGLHLEAETKVIEKIPSRNHTEVMLNLPVTHSEGKTIISVSKKNYPSPADYLAPSDISTAAFFIVLALLVKDSRLTLKNVSLNETRTGIIKVLQAMGGKIEILNQRKISGESLGDLVIYGSRLKNITIGEEIIPNIIDEIPILSAAGLFAEGDFIITKAKELRAKESDRISALCSNYKELGLDVEEYEDGFLLHGKIKNNKPVFESFGDHRIAMTFAILSLVLDNGGKMNSFGCVSISNPDFLQQLQKITRQ
jgi:3-phosphoshikimate 1-carboxyvinyltransferase